MLEKLLLRPVLTFLLRLLFRVEVSGTEHFHAAGERVLILVNHQSFLDPMLVAVFLPKKPAFAINIYQAEKWYLRWVPWLFTLYCLDPGKPLSMKHLIQDLRKGAQVVVFPEGRITTSGGIMKIYDGAAMIAEKTGATILPVRIDGAEYSKLSRMKGKLRQRWFPKIRLTILPPVTFGAGSEVSSRAIYDIMTQAAFLTSNYRRPLLEGLLEAYQLHGGKHAIASDITRQSMNYRQLFTRSFVLSGKLERILPDDDRYIGVMLPSAMGALVTFVSLHMLCKIPCMLNFSAGQANILHACRIATVRYVLTSRAFVEKGKLEPLIEAMPKDISFIYLEDLRAHIGLSDKLAGLYHAFFPREALRGPLLNTDPDDPAVVLYTSGSEGTPKGVALSHANIQANVAQAIARLDLMPCDTVFNALPVFHSFGLTIGMLMPALRGLKTFLYPSPLHYRVIPELIYDTDATIMLGTDTFYNGYANYAHDYDFWAVRLAVAGAEKLKESTRLLYAERFGLPIMQGYGVTEASPAIAFNTPLEHKAGTIGRPFPMIECRLEQVEGLEKGGRLLVKGPNIMLGYLKADRPGEIQPQGEWYDTGDIVDIDEEGFITILGRAKRFAKIAGEMVSLAAVEEFACTLLPECAHAAIAVPDERKGEHVLLFTESQELSRETLIARGREKGVPELFLPKRVAYLEAIPRLGNGKIDYVTLKRVAESNNAS